MVSRDVGEGTRLYLLDVLRGLAAMCVVVWHYQHFYFTAPGSLPGDFVRQQQPFYKLLQPFYEEGLRAVQLFYVLSGFVIFLTYVDKMARRETGVGQFLTWRLSRLYPLHLVTLLIVAMLQDAYRRKTGQYFVYPFQDWPHFGLNLTFTSFWGWQSGFSFNGPVWSVSIEVFCYLVFGALAVTAMRWLPRWWPGVVFAVAAVGYAVSTNGPSIYVNLVGDGLMCFCVGGLLVPLYDMVRRSDVPRRSAMALAFLIAIAGLVVFERGMRDPRILNLAVFPALVLLLGLLQREFPDAGRPLRVIGDMTYSSYLVHFPIQLAMALIAALTSTAINYDHRGVFLAYIVLVLVVSAPCYYRFELPQQEHIRGWWRDRFVRER